LLSAARMEVPAEPQLSRQIVYDMYISFRDDIPVRIRSASAAARSLPAVAGADAVGSALYAAFLHPAGAGPYLLLLVVASSILVAGFFASSDLTAVIFDLVELARLEQLLGVPRPKGYFAQDLYDHHVGSPEWGIISWSNEKLFGVRLKNVWVRSLMFMNLWAALLVAVVGDAIAFFYGDPILAILATGLAIGVFLALTVAARVAIGSYPSRVLKILRQPEIIETWV
jgi:hypothetical protein